MEPREPSGKPGVFSGPTGAYLAARPSSPAVPSRTTIEEEQREQRETAIMLLLTRLGLQGFGVRNFVIQAQTEDGVEWFISHAGNRLMGRVLPDHQRPEEFVQCALEVVFHVLETENELSDPFLLWLREYLARLLYNNKAIVEERAARFLERDSQNPGQFLITNRNQFSPPPIEGAFNTVNTTPKILPVNATPWQPVPTDVANTYDPNKWKEQIDALLRDRYGELLLESNTGNDGLIAAFREEDPRVLQQMATVLPSVIALKSGDTDHKNYYERVQTIVNEALKRFTLPLGKVKCKNPTVCETLLEPSAVFCGTCGYDQRLKGAPMPEQTIAVASTSTTGGGQTGAAIGPPPAVRRLPSLPPVAARSSPPPAAPVSESLSQGAYPQPAEPTPVAAAPAKEPPAPTGARGEESILFDAAAAARHSKPAPAIGPAAVEDSLVGGPQALVVGASVVGPVSLAPPALQPAAAQPEPTPVVAPSGPRRWPKALGVIAAIVVTVWMLWYFSLYLQAYAWQVAGVVGTILIFTSTRWLRRHFGRRTAIAAAVVAVTTWLVVLYALWWVWPIIAHTLGV